jgi:hypothetical protein
VQLSRVGFTFGTPPYMSPEHATGGMVDGRSDLYSVGILLFEMLAGQKPFDGELHEVIRHHLSTPVPKLAERKEELAGRDDLQLIIDRCMAKSREARFGSALDLLRALEEAITNSARPLAVLDARPSEREGDATDATVRKEALALVTSAGRLGLALWRWLHGEALPWVQERIAGLRGRLAERGAGLRGSIEQIGHKTEERARESWRAAQPRLEQAKQQLAKVAEDAKAKLRPSKAPPALAAGEAESAATIDAPVAEAADRSMSEDMTHVLPAPASARPPSLSRAAPAARAREASSSIEQDATLDLGAHEAKQKPKDVDATMVDEE